MSALANGFVPEDECKVRPPPVMQQRAPPA
jgi:hypothetical protein